MLKAVTQFLEGKSKAQVASISLVLLALVAVLDHWSGYELAFSIFYLAPVVIFTWYTNRIAAFAFCLLAAAVWLFVEVASGHPYSNSLIPVWNTGVRLGFFVGTAYLLDELKRNNIAVERLASTDGLTGVLNARAFKEKAAYLLELARRHAQPLVLGYIDVDNFKTVNDTQGHDEGDRVLTALTGVMAGAVRGTDLVGRMGGDEFAILLPMAQLADARRVFGRIQERTRQERQRHNWPIGFSIGVVVFTRVPDDFGEALKRADELMYRVKKSGKDDVAYEEVPGAAA